MEYSRLSKVVAQVTKMPVQHIKIYEFHDPPRYVVVVHVMFIEKWRKSCLEINDWAFEVDGSSATLCLLC